jgi:hypothetical protein
MQKLGRTNCAEKVSERRSDAVGLESVQDAVPCPPL